MGSMFSRSKALAPYPDPIDLTRFSDRWYVVAVKPTPFEKGAYNPIESYHRRSSNSTIFDVSFTFNKNSLTGPKKSIPQILHTNTKGGDWQVQPISWLPFFKLSYTILDIGGDASVSGESKYSHVVVGHPSRNYFWVMARESRMEQAKLDGLLEMLRNSGFDTKQTVFPKHDNGQMQSNVPEKQAKKDL